MREQIKLQLGIITSSSILYEAAGIQPPIPNIDRSDFTLEDEMSTMLRRGQGHCSPNL